MESIQAGAHLRRGATDEPPPQSVALGMVVLDASWRIVETTEGLAEAVGLPDRLVVRGASILPSVHPNDLVRLVSYMETVAAQGRVSRPIRVRLSTPADRWLTVRTTILPMAGLGAVALMLEGTILGEGDDPGDRIADLEQRLARIGAEVSDLRGDPPVITERARAMAGQADLSDRQTEILHRLADGYRVPQIARDLYLSQSTVRNHLMALFRKFNVTSQAELLDVLRSAVAG